MKRIQRWIQARWRHGAFLAVCLSITYAGYTHLRQPETRQLKLFSNVNDVEAIIGNEEVGGRLQRLELHHYFFNGRNEIRAFFNLRPGTKRGSILLYMDVMPEYETLSNDIILEPAQNIDNALLVRYNADTSVRTSFTLKFPSFAYTQLGIFAFQIPNRDMLQPNEGFEIAYTFYPPSDATVAVSGTQGKPVDDAFGFTWPDSRQVVFGTTVSVTSPSLQREAQVSFAIGAVLIAVGVNLITNYFYTSIQHHIRTSSGRDT